MVLNTKSLRYTGKALSLRLNSTAQISKDALILTIVVTHFRQNWVQIFREYWQLEPQQKAPFMTRAYLRGPGEQKSPDGYSQFRGSLAQATIFDRSVEGF
jgi:hypothetical protein